MCHSFARPLPILLICLLAACGSGSRIQLTESDRADLQLARQSLEQSGDKTSLLYRVFEGNPAKVAREVAGTGDRTLIGAVGGYGATNGHATPLGLECNSSVPMEKFVFESARPPEGVLKSMLIYNLTMMDQLGFVAQTGCKVSATAKQDIRQWGGLPLNF